jgi:outer membrane protein assembly factor BamA
MIAFRLSLALLLLCVYTVGSAQMNGIPDPQTFSALHPDTPAPPTGWVKVKSILIAGNKKTKDYIIRREMTVKPGDSIQITSLGERLETMRQNIYNTTLFVKVSVEPFIINAYECDLLITVKERLYIFPIPEFQLVDRSWDEWITKYNGSLKRVNYGLKFVHYNFSGRKDQLKISFINGYTRNVSAYYNAPYVNKKLTNGFFIGAGFSQTKEIPYKTNYDNSLAFYSNGGFVKDSWFINGGYTVRHKINTTQIFSVGYTNVLVADTIISNGFNANYFNSLSKRQGIVDLGYTLRYAKVNNILYPLTGRSFYVSLIKRGLGWRQGVNMFSIEGEYNRFFSLGKKWYTSMQFTGNIKLPFKQPFINLRALGDRNNYLRGLEYSTIDGVAFTTAKFNLKREILSFSIPTFFRSKTYNKIPFRFFAKTFADFGYVYNRYPPLTRLNNKFLYTSGFGLDILTLYDLHLRLDYSFDQLGRRRLAFSNQSGF